MSRRRLPDMGLSPEELSLSGSPYEAVLMAAEYSEVPKLDLHANTKHEALHKLEQFLYAEQYDGAEVVRIVHGKGQNILAPAVRHWLAEQKENGILVADFRDSENSFERGAVVLVALTKLNQ